MMSIPKKFLLFLCSLLLLPQVAWAQEVIPIERAVEIALLNNPELRISRSDVDISKSILRQAKSPLYPQLSGKLVVPFVGRESGFYVDQMIWDFGKTKARIRAREHHLESAEHLLTGSKTILVRDTRIAYYLGAFREKPASGSGHEDQAQGMASREDPGAFRRREKIRPAAKPGGNRPAAGKTRACFRRELLRTRHA